MISPVHLFIFIIWKVFKQLLIQLKHSAIIYGAYTVAGVTLTYLKTSFPSCSEWGVINSTLLLSCSIMLICSGLPVHQSCRGALYRITDDIYLPVCKHLVVLLVKYFLISPCSLVMADNSSLLASLCNTGTWISEYCNSRLLTCPASCQELLYSFLLVK